MVPYRFPRLVHHSLANTAHSYPDRPAVVTDDHTLSYGKLLHQAQRLAGSMHRLGVEPGDRVVLFMENGPSSCTAIYAALIAGVVFVVVNPQTRADKLAFILDDCGATLLVSEGHLLRTFSSIVGERSALRAIICGGKDAHLAAGAHGPPAMSLEEALSGSELGPEERSIPLDLAGLVYTSGTTGTPKGVMLSHQSILFTVGSICDYLEIDQTDRILSVLPLAFTYGLYQLLTAAAVGATLVLERSFTYPARVLERLVQMQATVLPGVPSIWARLVAMHRKEPLRFPCVHRITNAAAALPESHIAPLLEIFPNAALYKMYGQTECARGCFLHPASMEARPGSVGKAIPGTELLVLGSDGLPAPPHEPGILHIRGPHVMLGYWNLPDETARTLRPGRFPGERMLCTHDWFKTDEDGYHYYVGRSDDIIKTLGEKVSPVEIENVLFAIDGVEEAAVVGVPDEFMGQAVRAHVVLTEGASLGVRDIEAICRRRLESFMVPREIVIETELPKTPSGKIRKQDLLRQ